MENKKKFQLKDIKMTSSTTIIFVEVKKSPTIQKQILRNLEWAFRFFRLTIKEDFVSSRCFWGELYQRFQANKLAIHSMFETFVSALDPNKKERNWLKVGRVVFLWVSSKT